MGINQLIIFLFTKTYFNLFVGFLASLTKRSCAIYGNKEELGHAALIR